MVDRMPQSAASEEEDSVKKAPTKQAKKAPIKKAPKKGVEGNTKKRAKHDEDAAPVSKRHVSVEDREVTDPKGLSKALTALEAVDEELTELQARRQKTLGQVRSAAGSASFVHPKSGLKFTIQGRAGVLFIREAPVPTPSSKKAPAKKTKKKSKD